MNSLGSVSRRTKAIYERFYQEREAKRYANLYFIFEQLAAHVDASDLGAKLEIDYLSLGEIVRSYFLDVIRYKEYHFDPPPKLTTGSVKSLQAMENDQGTSIGIDPLSPEWTESVHSLVNVNASKVAAFTVKWILKNKPISVMNAATQIHQNLGTALPMSFDPFLANINEHFSLHCAFIALDIDARQVSSRKIDELIYCFRFRNFDESAYFMILSRENLLAKESI